MNIALALIFFISSLQAITFKSDISLPNKSNERSFSIDINMQPSEVLYDKSFSLNTDSPHIAINKWNPSIEPTEQLDKITKEIKNIWKESFVVNGTLDEKESDPDAQLIIRYMTNKMEAPEFKTFAIHKKNKSSEKHIYEAPSKKDSTQENENPVTCPSPHQKKATLSSYVQRLIASTSSLWLRLLLVLLLGLLMSLTPCIYPMIPITVGILQAQGKKSLGYNFLLAFCYMLGIAFMFAMLGFSAAMTGSLFGKMMSKPIVVIVIVLVLLYFAFSMFDFYEIKMPRFLAQRKQKNPKGSLVSAFIFGVVSGTIASPCLSPGLAFLLTIVASLGNKFLGFALLFMFGVGMSIPLLLIGTFSTSLKFIPKTGMWMMEVKKLFGLLLVALCFYYLSNIMSITLLLWLIASTSLLFGIYYLLTARKEIHKITSYFKIIFGIGALCCTIFFYYKAIVRTWYPEKPQSLISWQTNYKEAQKFAQKNHKLLFVDFGAPYCSICKAIDRCILNEALVASLINQMVPVKIDAANSSEYEQLNKKFSIIGVPTILVVKPSTEKIVHRWGAEIYSQTKQEISETLGNIIKN